MSKELAPIEEIVEGELVEEDAPQQLEQRTGERPLIELMQEAYEKGLTRRLPETSMIAAEDAFMEGFMGAPDARQILIDRAKNKKTSTTTKAVKAKSPKEITDGR